jgi:hypothetical protein
MSDLSTFTGCHGGWGLDFGGVAVAVTETVLVAAGATKPVLKSQALFPATWLWRVLVHFTLPDKDCAFLFQKG